MPELPDVEKHRRLVDEHAVGGTVKQVKVRDAELLEGTTPQGLGRSLTGRRVSAARRHGKWLLLNFDGPTLVVHFRMSGELVWSDDRGDGRGEDGGHDADAVTLHLDRGLLGYRTGRRLGRVTFVPASGDVEEVTGPLGPDATDVGREELGEIVRGRRGGLKSALMDQRRIAGLGNELVDEILWRARLHPRQLAGDLSDRDLAALYKSMRKVLRDSIRAGHVPSGPTWLNRQRREDEPRCPRCNRSLRTAQVAGRTTLWCPKEQPGPG